MRVLEGAREDLGPARTGCGRARWRWAGEGRWQGGGAVRRKQREDGDKRPIEYRLLPSF